MSARAIIAAVALSCFACSEPERLVAGTCGDGVVESGEDCDGASGGPGLTCAPPGTPHACHFVCDPMMAAVQCPAGDTCGPGGVCIAAPGACGNGVVDTGEECDPRVATSLGTCGAPGTANACHFVCSASIACPSGASCGRDGRCREPNGQFVAAAPRPFPSYDTLQLLDVDGDGILDLVASVGLANLQVFPEPLVIQFGAGDGTFPHTVAFPVGAAAIGDVTGNGRPSFALQSADGGPVQIAVAQPDRTFTLAPFPTFTVPTPGLIDKWIPIHPVAGNPLVELLHFSDNNGTATFAFDQVIQDFNAVTVPDVFPAFSDFTAGQPPQFAVADVLDDPSFGGDEIAIGLIGTSTIQVYTASAAGTNPVTGAPELPYHLKLDTTISLSQPLLMSPIFADVDGDGLLDIIAVVGPNPAGPPTVFDILNTGTGFAAPAQDTLLTQRECTPTAAAKLFGGGPSEIFCEGAVFKRSGGFLVDISPDGDEAVFPDINRDGIPDIVMGGRAQQASLTVLYGSKSGLFAPATVPAAGVATNLRVGDFNGDGIDDVVFFTTLVTGEQQYAVLYGSVDQLAAPVPIATLAGVASAEPGVLAPDATLSPIFPSAISDLVVSSRDPNGNAFVTELMGNTNRTMTSAGFSLLAPNASSQGITMGPVAIGRFASGQGPRSLAVPIQGQIPVDLFGTLDVVGVVTDQNQQPINQQPTTLSSIAAPGLVPPNFLLAECPQMALSADFDGDGLDEVVYLQSFFLPMNAGCTSANPPPLAVFQTQAPTALPAPMPTTLTHIAELRALDVDHDGHLDLVAVFTGDTLTCNGSVPCVPTGNGIFIMWGSATGLGSATSQLVSPATDGQIFDVAMLPLGPGDAGHVIVATQTGVIVYDVAGDRSLTRAANLTTTQATAIATGDVDGDGLIDLVTDTPMFPGGGQITVLFAQAQPIAGP